jgi:hypothetical protein
MKVSELSLDQFTAKVKEVLKTNDDISAITKTVYDKRGNYQVVNAIKMVEAAKKKEEKLKNAIVKTGLLIGTKDKKNSKAPIKAALIMQNQAHIEILLWDTRVPYADGVESPLIYPAFCEVALTTSERGGLMLERILKYKKLDTPKDVIATLEKLKAITTSEGVKSPDKDTFKFPITCMKGEIISVGPILSSSYDDEDKTYYDVLVEDDKRVTTKHPALNIKLKTEDNTTIWAKITPRRYSKGYYSISDLDMALNDAMKDGETPKDQAELMGALLSGREVIVVGAVTNKDDNPQYGMTISMDTFAMIELGGEEITEEVFEPQQTLPKPEEKKDDTDTEEMEELGKPDGDKSTTNTSDMGTTGNTKQKTRKTKQRNDTTEQIDNGKLGNTSIEEIKKKLLWKSGILSGKKTIEEQKQYLSGLKFQEDIIDKLKFADWVVVTAKQQGIDVDNDVAIGLIKVAYDELTDV